MNLLDFRIYHEGYLQFIFSQKGLDEKRFYDNSTSGGYVLNGGKFHYWQNYMTERLYKTITWSE